VPTSSALPEPGVPGQVFVAIDTGVIYAWSTNSNAWESGGGGGGGIASINGNTTSAQVITGGTGISVSSSAGTTTITNTGSGGGQFIIDPTSSIPVFQVTEDFLPYNYEVNTSNPVGILGLAFQGSCAALATNTDTRVGFVEYTVDSSVTSSGFVSALQPILFGASSQVFAGSFYIPSLPTVTNSYGISFGFGDSFPAVNNSALLFFNYLNANWQGQTYSNDVGTNYVDLGIPVTTGWNDVRVEVNTAGTEVMFYINGTAASTSITTNIPTAYPVGLFCLVIWYAGASVTVTQDWVQYNYQFVSDRGTY
jgi:hypothetical protein